MSAGTDMYGCLQGGGSSAEREQLILDHLPQVRLVARRIHERLPEHMSLDDLISAGIIGLISAIDHFDLSQNVQLKTYAEYKIRGAILDSLRGLDWAPRDRRKKSKQIESAITAAEQRLHRTPNEEEIAEELKVSLDEYQAWLAQIQGINLLNLESALELGNQNIEEQLPSWAFERSELEALLARGIETIPEAERMVLSLYFREELTLKEIGKVMKVHLSRVGQLKAQAILRLRAYIEKRWQLRPAPGKVGSSAVVR